MQCHCSVSGQTRQKSKVPGIYWWVQNLWLFNKASYQGNQQLYHDASPIFVVSSKSAPTCIVQGLIDTIVPRSQATELSKQLSSSGVPYKWIPFCVGQGFSGVPAWQKTIIDLEPLAPFIKAHTTAAHRPALEEGCQRRSKSRRARRVKALEKSNRHLWRASRAT